MTAAEKRAADPTTEYQDYEICCKSKVGKYIQEEIEFFIVDMEKKKVYLSYDLRLRDISEKVDKESTFIIRRAEYC